MRFLAVPAAILLTASMAWAHGLTDRPPDARELADLEAKAAIASPRDQPFLYAELVHSMTTIATEQLQAGDEQQANASLRAAQGYASRIHAGLLRDAKKLKNAEILLRHTAFRLRGLLTGAPPGDRETLEATIRQLNQVQTEMMMQVFQQ